jgi:DNA-binding HxlR family transcriptional regulator
LLSARLKSLERVGVVQRTTNGKNVSYHLTESGEVLKPIVMQLGGAPLGAQ